MSYLSDAELVELANAFAQNGDENTAFTIFKEGCDFGQGFCTLYYARCLRDGFGCVQDIEESINVF